MRDQATSHVSMHSAPSFTQDMKQKSDHYLKYYKVDRAVAVARAMLSRAHVLNHTSERLAVMLLYSHSIKDTSYGELTRSRRGKFAQVRIPDLSPARVIIVT